MTIQEYMAANREEPEPKYQAILIAPDGDFVTDYKGDTPEEVWERVADRGSRWFFYPFAFVVTNDGRLMERKRIISAPEQLEFLKGKTVQKVRRFIRENPWLLEAC